MTIDGKENVKKRIKVFENDRYTTYLYILENGNKYKDTVSKWTQKDKSISKGNYADTWLDNNYWKKI